MVKFGKSDEFEIRKGVRQGDSNNQLSIYVLQKND